MTAARENFPIISFNLHLLNENFSMVSKLNYNLVLYIFKIQTTFSNAKLGNIYNSNITGNSW